MNETSFVSLIHLTKVELFKILFRDQESIVVEVMNQAGFVRKYPLELIEDKTSLRYVAELWLNYQHEIKYRFVIESEGKELFTSAIHEKRAGHIISEKWEPDPNGTGFIVQQDEASLRRAAFMKEITQTRAQHVGTSRPLCQPSFVAEIKSLLEDLF
jgi:hypothetical protein